MDMAGGVQPLPYGHSTEVAVDIEGLAVCYLRISAFRDWLTAWNYSY